MLAGCACERGPPSPPFSGASRRTLAASVSPFDPRAQATPARAVEPPSPPALRRRTPALRDARDTALLRRRSAAPARSARDAAAHPFAHRDGALRRRRSCACCVFRLRARASVLTPLREGSSL